MATTVLNFDGYATQVNRHTGLEMNDEADGWSSVATAVTASRQGSSLFVSAKASNTLDLLLSINGGSGVIPIPAGQSVSIDDMPITSFQVTNADVSNKYHFELYLDKA